MANNPLQRAQLNTGYQMDLSNFDPSAPSTELSSILEDYDTEKLTAEYDMFFDEYDPSQERFAQRGLELQEGDIGARFQQQQGRFAREGEALDFGQQQQAGAMQRAESSFGLAQQGLDLDAQQSLSQQEFQRGQFSREQDLIDRREGQTLDSGRDNLMTAYEQQQENQGGGFSGAGRRDVRAQRAIDAQTGAFESQLSNLRDTSQDLLSRQDLSETRFGIDESRRDLQRDAMGLDREAELARFGAQDFQRGQQRGELSDQMGFAQGSMERDLSRAGLGFEQDVFGMRQRFQSDTRRSLIDLIESGADVDRFRLDADLGGDFGNTMSNMDAAFGQGNLGLPPNQSADATVFPTQPFNLGGGLEGDFDAMNPNQAPLSLDAQNYFSNREGYEETQSGQNFYNVYGG
tara:strand:+ start:1009 stop:2220 length:1212 start_codon:yes stop_codon:yes gene_type:complete